MAKFNVKILKDVNLLYHDGSRNLVDGEVVPDNHYYRNLERRGVIGRQKKADAVKKTDTPHQPLNDLKGFDMSEKNKMKGGDKK